MFNEGMLCKTEKDDLKSVGRSITVRSFMKFYEDMIRVQYKLWQILQLELHSSWPRIFFSTLQVLMSSSRSSRWHTHVMILLVPNCLGSKPVSCGIRFSFLFIFPLIVPPPCLDFFSHHPMINRVNFSFAWENTKPLVDSVSGREIYVW